MCDENSLFFYLNNFLNGGIIKKKTRTFCFHYLSISCFVLL